MVIAQILVCIFAIVCTILPIVLFFKVWGMCNDVKEIKEILEKNESNNSIHSV
jgi:hypothetical protein